MNRFLTHRLPQWTLLSGLILVVVWPTAPAIAAEADKQDSSLATTEEVLEVLDWGFRMATSIPVKPHLAERSKAQYLALKAFVAMGHVEELDARIANILDWRRGQLCAETATYLARQGRHREAKNYIDRAKAARESITGWHASWQKERVKAAVKAAEVTLEEARTGPIPEPALAAVSIYDPVHPITETYSRIHSEEEYNKAMEALAPMMKSANWEVQQTAALTYIRVLSALGTKATDEQCEQIKQNVFTLGKKLPTLMLPDLYCGLSRAASAAGHHEMAVKVLSKMVAELDQRELNARFDVAILVQVADALREVADDRQGAADLLRKADALLSRSELLPLDRIPALLSLVKGYTRHGNHDKAWHHLRQALDLAQAQPNRRPRATWMTDICIAVAQSRLPLPMAGRNILLRELNRLEVER